MDNNVSKADRVASLFNQEDSEAGAGKGIVEGTVMVFERNAEEVAEAVERFGRQHPSRNPAAGGLEGAVKFLILRRVEHVDFAGGLNTFRVECCIVGHEGKALEPVVPLFPDIAEPRGILHIAVDYAVDLNAERGEKFRLGLYQRIFLVDNQAILDLHGAYGADAGRILVCCLDVYGYEIVHLGEHFNDA